MSLEATNLLRTLIKTNKDKLQKPEQPTEPVQQPTPQQAQQQATPQPSQEPKPEPKPKPKTEPEQTQPQQQVAPETLSFGQAMQQLVQGTPDGEINPAFAQLPIIQGMARQIATTGKVDKTALFKEIMEQTIPQEVRTPKELRSKSTDEKIDFLLEKAPEDTAKLYRAYVSPKNDPSPTTEQAMPQSTGMGILDIFKYATLPPSHGVQYAQRIGFEDRDERKDMRTWLKNWVEKAPSDFNVMLNNAKNGKSTFDAVSGDLDTWKKSVPVKIQEKQSLNEGIRLIERTIPQEARNVYLKAHGFDPKEPVDMRDVNAWLFENPEAARPLYEMAIRANKGSNVVPPRPYEYVTTGVMNTIGGNARSEGGTAKVESGIINIKPEEVTGLEREAEYYKPDLEAYIKKHPEIKQELRQFALEHLGDITGEGIGEGTHGIDPMVWYINSLRKSDPEKFESIIREVYIDPENIYGASRRNKNYFYDIFASLNKVSDYQLRHDTARREAKEWFDSEVKPLVYKFTRKGYEGVENAQVPEMKDWELTGFLDVLSKSNPDLARKLMTKALEHESKIKEHDALRIMSGLMDAPDSKKMTWGEYFTKYLPFSFANMTTFGYLNWTKSTLPMIIGKKVGGLLGPSGLVIGTLAGNVAGSVLGASAEADKMWYESYQKAVEAGANKLQAYQRADRSRDLIRNFTILSNMAQNLLIDQFGDLIKPYLPHSFSAGPLGKAIRTVGSSLLNAVLEGNEELQQNILENVGAKNISMKDVFTDMAKVWSETADDDAIKEFWAGFWGGLIFAPIQSAIYQGIGKTFDLGKGVVTGDVKMNDFSQWFNSLPKNAKAQWNQFTSDLKNEISMIKDWGGSKFNPDFNVNFDGLNQDMVNALKQARAKNEEALQSTLNMKKGEANLISRAYENISAELIRMGANPNEVLVEFNNLGDTAQQIGNANRQTLDGKGLEERLYRIGHVDFVNNPNGTTTARIGTINNPSVDTQLHELGGHVTLRHIEDLAFLHDNPQANQIMRMIVEGYGQDFDAYRNAYRQDTMVNQNTPEADTNALRNEIHESFAQDLEKYFFVNMARNGMKGLGARVSDRVQQFYGDNIYRLDSTGVVPIAPNVVQVLDHLTGGKALFSENSEPTTVTGTPAGQQSATSQAMNPDDPIGNLGRVLQSQGQEQIQAQEQAQAQAQAGNLETAPVQTQAQGEPVTPVIPADTVTDAISQGQFSTSDVQGLTVNTKAQARPLNGKKNAMYMIPLNELANIPADSPLAKQLSGLNVFFTKDYERLNNAGVTQNAIFMPEKFLQYNKKQGIATLKENGKVIDALTEMLRTKGMELLKRYETNAGNSVNNSPVQNANTPIANGILAQFDRGERIELHDGDDTITLYKDFLNNEVRIGAMIDAAEDSAFSNTEAKNIANDYGMETIETSDNSATFYIPRGRTGEIVLDRVLRDFRPLIDQAAKGQIIDTASGIEFDQPSEAPVREHREQTNAMPSNPNPVLDEVDRATVNQGFTEQQAPVNQEQTAKSTTPIVSDIERSLVNSTDSIALKDGNSVGLTVFKRKLNGQDRLVIGIGDADPEETRFYGEELSDYAIMGIANKYGLEPLNGRNTRLFLVPQGVAGEQALAAIYRDFRITKDAQGNEFFDFAPIARDPITVYRGNGNTHYSYIDSIAEKYNINNKYLDGDTPVIFNDRAQAGGVFNMEQGLFVNSRYIQDGRFVDDGTFQEALNNAIAQRDLQKAQGQENYKANIESHVQNVTAWLNSPNTRSRYIDTDTNNEGVRFIELGYAFKNTQAISNENKWINSIPVYFDGYNKGQSDLNGIHVDGDILSNKGKLPNPSLADTDNPAKYSGKVAEKITRLKAQVLPQLIDIMTNNREGIISKAQGDRRAAREALSKTLPILDVAPSMESESASTKNPNAAGNANNEIKAATVSRGTPNAKQEALASALLDIRKNLELMAQLESYFRDNPAMPSLEPLLKQLHQEALQTGVVVEQVEQMAKPKYVNRQAQTPYPINLNTPVVNGYLQMFANGIYPEPLTHDRATLTLAHEVINGENRLAAQIKGRDKDRIAFYYGFERRTDNGGNQSHDLLIPKGYDGEVLLNELTNDFKNTTKNSAPWLKFQLVDDPQARGGKRAVFTPREAEATAPNEPQTRKPRERSTLDRSRNRLKRAAQAIRTATAQAHRHLMGQAQENLLRGLSQLREAKIGLEQARGEFLRSLGQDLGQGTRGEGIVPNVRLQAIDKLHGVYITRLGNVLQNAVLNDGQHDSIRNIPVVFGANPNAEASSNIDLSDAIRLDRKYIQVNPNGTATLKTGTSLLEDLYLFASDFINNRQEQDTLQGETERFTPSLSAEEIGTAIEKRNGKSYEDSPYFTRLQTGEFLNAFSVFEPVQGLNKVFTARLGDILESERGGELAEALVVIGNDPKGESELGLDYSDAIRIKDSGFVIKNSQTGEYTLAPSQSRLDRFLKALYQARRKYQEKQLEPAKPVTRSMAAEYINQNARLQPVLDNAAYQQQIDGVYTARLGDILEDNRLLDAPAGKGLENFTLIFGENPEHEADVIEKTSRAITDAYERDGYVRLSDKYLVADATNPNRVRLNQDPKLLTSLLNDIYAGVNNYLIQNERPTYPAYGQQRTFEIPDWIDPNKPTADTLAPTLEPATQIGETTQGMENGTGANSGLSMATAERAIDNLFGTRSSFKTFNTLERIKSAYQKDFNDGFSSYNGYETYILLLRSNIRDIHAINAHKDGANGFDIYGSIENSNGEMTIWYGKDKTDAISTPLSHILIYFKKQQGDFHDFLVRYLTDLFENNPAFGQNWKFDQQSGKIIGDDKGTLVQISIPDVASLIETLSLQSLGTKVLSKAEWRDLGRQPQATANISDTLTPATQPEATPNNNPTATPETAASETTASTGSQGTDNSALIQILEDLELQVTAKLSDSAGRPVAVLDTLFNSNQLGDNAARLVIFGEQQTGDPSDAIYVDRGFALKSGKAISKASNKPKKLKASIIEALKNTTATGDAITNTANNAPAAHQSHSESRSEFDLIHEMAIRGTPDFRATLSRNSDGVFETTLGTVYKSSVIRTHPEADVLNEILVRFDGRTNSNANDEAIHLNGKFVNGSGKISRSAFTLERFTRDIAPEIERVAKLKGIQNPDREQFPLYSNQALDNFVLGMSRPEVKPAKLQRDANGDYYTTFAKALVAPEFFSAHPEIRDMLVWFDDKEGIDERGAHIPVKHEYKEHGQTFYDFITQGTLETYKPYKLKGLLIKALRDAVYNNPVQQAAPSTAATAQQTVSTIPQGATEAQAMPADANTAKPVNTNTNGEIQNAFLSYLPYQGKINAFNETNQKLVRVTYNNEPRLAVIPDLDENDNIITSRLPKGVEHVVETDKWGLTYDKFFIPKGDAGEQVLRLLFENQNFPLRKFVELVGQNNNDRARELLTRAENRFYQRQNHRTHTNSPSRSGDILDEFGLSENDIQDRVGQSGLSAPERGSFFGGLEGDTTSGYDQIIKVVDPALERRLQNEIRRGEYVVRYRAMVKIGDNLYSPMATKDANGNLSNPIKLGQLEMAEEKPVDAYGNIIGAHRKKGKDGKWILDQQTGRPAWYVNLTQDNDKTFEVRYNPYIHTTDTPLNDQFTSANQRDNLVIVEVKVPKSGYTQDKKGRLYKARGAKDSVGDGIRWSGGNVDNELDSALQRKVLLTRYDMPVRVVPDSEVASLIYRKLAADTSAKGDREQQARLNGKPVSPNENVAPIESLPYNIVTPGVARELQWKYGIEISDMDSTDWVRARKEARGEVLPPRRSPRFRGSREESLGLTDRRSGYDQLIGERGAIRLDELDENTLRRDSLELARQLTAIGRDADAIWSATGWEQGKDGKWRYEIPDGEINRHAELKNPEGMTTLENYNSISPELFTTLGELYSGDELYKAYPELKDVGIVFEKMPSQVAGGYSDKDGKIHLNFDLFITAEADDKFNITGFCVDTLFGELDKILSHERQHCIQYLEGFAVGSSDEYGMDNKGLSYADSKLRYLAQAGEVEARNAGRRLGLSPERRKGTAPHTTEDISREYQYTDIDDMTGFDGNRDKIRQNLSDSLLAQSTSGYDQLIGEQGATHLDEANISSFRKDGLTIAKQMEAKGLDPKKIWMATGWEKGADNKWRYEIPDAEINRNAKLVLDGNLEYREVYGYTTTLGELYPNEELYDAYPEMRDIKVEFTFFPRGEGSTLGGYALKAKKILLNGKKFLDKVTLENVYNPGFKNVKPLLSTLVHEIQHAIQKLEGFALGADPSKIQRDEKLDKHSAYRAYREYAGEVEARNVQSRLSKTPEERAAIPPQETESVPRSGQTIRFESGFDQIIGELGAAELSKAKKDPKILDDLQVALDMEKTRRILPEKIRLATGWERGVDGKMRYEILDGTLVKDAILNNDKWSVRLGNIYQNDELYAAYPELRYLSVRFDQYLDIGEGATYYGDVNNDSIYRVSQMKYDAGITFTPEEMVKQAKFDVGIKGLTEENFDQHADKLAGVFGHEIQHYIQDREGFASGGNPSMHSGSFEWYHHLAGEVEARNVQNRMNLPPEQRRRQALEETADYSRNNQIVRYNENDRAVIESPEYQSFLKNPKAITDSIDAKVSEAYKRIKAQQQSRGFDQTITASDFSDYDKSQYGKELKYNLRLAHELAQQGESPELIRLATGWERGSNGEFRTGTLNASVIDRGNLKLDNTGYMNTTLGQIYHNPELFRNYPSYRDVPVKFVGNEDLNGAKFDVDKGEIKLNRNYFLDVDENRNYGLNTGDELISTLNHAAQDLLQQDEELQASPAMDNRPDVLKTDTKRYGSWTALRELPQEQVQALQSLADAGVIQGVKAQPKQADRGVQDRKARRGGFDQVIKVGVAFDPEYDKYAANFTDDRVEQMFRTAFLPENFTAKQRASLWSSLKEAARGENWNISFNVPNGASAKIFMKELKDGLIGGDLHRLNELANYGDDENSRQVYTRLRDRARTQLQMARSERHSAFEFEPKQLVRALEPITKDTKISKDERNRLLDIAARGMLLEDLWYEHQLRSTNSDFNSDANLRADLEFGFTEETLQEEFERFQNMIYGKNGEAGLPQVAKTIRNIKNLLKEHNNRLIEASHRLGYYDIDATIGKPIGYLREMVKAALFQKFIQELVSQNKNVPIDTLIRTFGIDYAKFKPDIGDLDYNTNFFDIMERMFIEKTRNAAKLEALANIREASNDLIDTLRIKAIQAENGHSDVIEGARQFVSSQMDSQTELDFLVRLTELAEFGELPLRSNAEHPVTSIAGLSAKERNNYSFAEAVHDITDAYYANVGQSPLYNEHFIPESAVPYIKWLSNLLIEDNPNINAAQGNTRRSRRNAGPLYRQLFGQYQGFVEYNPRIFSGLHEAYIDANVEQSLKARGFEVNSEALDAFRASPEQRWFIPKPLADTLDQEFGRPKEHGSLYRVGKDLTTIWKKVQIMNPQRFFKFSMRNIAGDFDAMLAINPHAWKYLGEAFWEAVQSVRGKTDPDGQFATYLRLGGQGVTRYSSEISTEFEQRMKSLTKQEVLNNLKNYKNPQDMAKGIMQILGKGWSTFFGSFDTFSEARESIIRYAMYRSYLEQMQEDLRSGGEGRPKNWGASLRGEVMSIDSDHLEQRAFKMSNEAIGAYDQISDTGKQLRQILIPFWSWTEANFRRYFRLFNNARIDGDLMGGARIFGLTSARGIGNMLLTYLKCAALSSLLGLWNRTVAREADDELPEEVRSQPHFTFGKSGETVYFLSRVGAFSDFLQDFNADKFASIPELLEGILRNDISILNTAKGMVGSVINERLNSLTPFIRMPIEHFTGYKWYPNIFDKRNIHDVPNYLASSFGLVPLMNSVLNNPGKKLSVRSLFADMQQGLESAYWDIDRWKANFKGKTIEQYDRSEDAKLRRRLRAAIRSDEHDIVMDCMAQYMKMGHTPKEMQKVLQSLNPNFGLSKAELVKFQSTFDKRQWQRYAQAQKFYERCVRTYNQCFKDFTRSPEYKEAVRAFRQAKKLEDQGIREAQRQVSQFRTR